MSEQAVVEYVGRIGGRPSSFTQDVAEEICSRLANGESLSFICADERMPDRVTVYRWRRDHEQFRNDYAQARAMQSDTFADQIQDIADCFFIPAATKAAMIDARKWRAARQNWRSWGDKVAHEHEHSHTVALDASCLPPALQFLADNSAGEKG